MRHEETTRILKPVLLAALVLILPALAIAQSTQFTYQGSLRNGATQANGAFDFQFKLFDTAAVGSGTQQGSTLTNSNITVAGGVFTVQLDFGACATCFNGEDRFLEIAVKPTNGATFTTLSPRQPITPTPYAMKSLNATAADGLSVSCVNCVTSSQIQSVQASQITGTIPPESIPVAFVSSNAIVDGTIVDADVSPSAAIAPGKIAGTAATLGANSFTGTQSIVGGHLSLPNTTDATTGLLRIGGSRFLHSYGTNNVFLGNNAGNFSMTGSANTAVGESALSINNQGINNTAQGSSALRINTSGSNNTATGATALYNNGNGNYNTATGVVALGANTSGSWNTATGAYALQSNVTGGANTATGYQALFVGTDANNNTANGFEALRSNTSNDNTATGYRALRNNTLVGQNTADGSQALTSNTGGGANTATGYQAMLSNIDGTNNTAAGAEALALNISGNDNTAVGVGALVATTGSLNTGVGKQAGIGSDTGQQNTFIGAKTGTQNGANLTGSTAIGYNAQVTCSHCMVLGDATDNALSVGIGTDTPGGKLQVIGVSKVAINAFSYAETGVYGAANQSGIGVQGAGSPGGIAVNALGTSFFQGDTTPIDSKYSGAGVAIGSINYTTPDSVGYIFAYDYGANQARNLALNSPGGRVGIGTTTPDQTLSVSGNASKTGGGSWLVYSDERLKNINAGFTPGLEAVMQLQPIRYEYKSDNALNIPSNGEHIGFSAQAVQKVIPEAVTQTDKGYLLVNNDPIIWTMLNAIKEQQKEIEQLRKEVQEMREHK
jgi:trimeric autotransporter adhesin